MRQREIKFRFWSKILKKFVIPEDEIFIGAFRDKEMGLMQFTGLKDINGKEIYEGDIVWWKGLYVNKQIVYKQAGFYVNTARRTFPVPSQALTANKIHKVGMEVIGNVYENPELLESAKHQKKEKSNK